MIILVTAANKAIIECISKWKCQLINIRLHLRIKTQITADDCNTGKTPTWTNKNCFPFATKISEILIKKKVWKKKICLVFPKLKPLQLFTTISIMWILYATSFNLFYTVIPTTTKDIIKYDKIFLKIIPYIGKSESIS